MNSTVWPIFNKKVAEKWNLWIREKSNISAQKKKKKLKRKMCFWEAPYAHLIIVVICIKPMKGFKK